MEPQYIGYYRVSTQKQGRSGLGLQAQQNVVHTFLQGRTTMCDFTDVDSGTKSDRPNLMVAIDMAHRTGATLLVAKLDRLSRSVSFISQLMESKVKFTIAEMPEINEFVVYVLAIVSQNEQRMCSTRTKAALKVRKAQGMQLGHPYYTTGYNADGTKATPPLTKEVRELAAAVNIRKAETNENNKKALAMIRALSSQGMSYNTMAEHLNDAGFKTSRGCAFFASSVERIVKRHNKNIANKRTKAAL